MTAPPSLVILTHALQGPARGYFVEHLAALWRQGGWRVTLHQGLSPPPPPADAILLHVDLTRMPADYLAATEGYPLRLNATTPDIGKRTVSGNLVSRADSYDGPVMVKSERNAFGAPERRLALAQARGLRRWGLALRERLPPRLGGPLQAPFYPYYARKAEVPRWVWRRPDLVVERFLPQLWDGHYTVNQAYCLGPVWVVSTFCAPQRVVKIEQAVKLRPLHDEVPEAVRERRRALGLNYGKIDYVVHEGETQLLDANLTPWLGHSVTSERTREMNRRLAAGLDALFAAGATA